MRWTEYAAPEMSTRMHYSGDLVQPGGDRMEKNV